MFKIFGVFEESEAFWMPFTLDGEPIKDITFIFEHSYKTRPKFSPLLGTHERLCIAHDDQAIPSS